MELKSLTEVARLLGVQPYRITYCHLIGAVPEPTKVCGRRAYSETDINRIAGYFGEERHVRMKARAHQGYYIV